ncbi:MAG TPA: hypothetical protein VFI39_12625 [Gemmatimonadales bacterium]|nr:hypothetical protein [Gemmatimonadales bacterium]
MALPIRHPAGPVEAKIDAAPMVDVLVVLLLAAFLAQAFIRQRLPAGPAPVAATPAPISIEIPVVLEITARGALINGQPIPDTQLGPQLQAIYARRAVKVLFVRGAADRWPEEVARVARSAKVGVVALVPAGP